VKEFLEDPAMIAEYMKDIIPGEDGIRNKNNSITSRNISPSFTFGSKLNFPEISQNPLHVEKVPRKV
jgi:hypothetical protein